MRFDKKGLLVAAGYAEIDSMSAPMDFTDAFARLSACDDGGPYIEFRLDGLSPRKQRQECKLDCGDVGPKRMEEIDHVIISAWAKPEC